MSNEDTQVVDSAETTTTEEHLEDNTSENAGTGQSEDAETTEGSEQSSTETPEQRKSRLTRQAKRIQKQLAEFDEEGGEEGEKSSKEGRKEEGSKVDDERYARLELKTEGITSKKAQDIVLEYADYKGIDVVKASKSPIVRAEIAELEKKTSAPAPSGRTSSGASNTFEYWVGQAKKGNFPKGDKEMMKKLQKARIFTS